MFCRIHARTKSRETVTVLANDAHLRSFISLNTTLNLGSCEMLYNAISRRLRQTNWSAEITMELRLRYGQYFEMKATLNKSNSVPSMGLYFIQVNLSENQQLQQNSQNISLFLAKISKFDTRSVTPKYFDLTTLNCDCGQYRTQTYRFHEANEKMSHRNKLIPENWITIRASTFQ